MKRAITTGMTIAILSGACGDSPTELGVATRILTVSLPTAAIALAQPLDVRLDGSGAVEVHYWSNEGPRLRIVSDTQAARHQLVLTRLRAGRDYDFEVRLSGDPDGDVRTGSFTTDALPEGIAVLDFTTSGTPTQPLTALEINTHDGGWMGVVVVDDAGEVVWHYGEGPVAGFDRRANGNFIVMDGASGVLEVAPDGRTVRARRQPTGQNERSHHDAIVTPWNTVLFIAFDIREHDGRDITGEAIWEWIPETGATHRRWSSWDEMSPDVDWGGASRDTDWLHANSISLGPRGNILMSFRFTNQVISIAPDFSHIEWRLGGVNADIAAEGDATFIGQHTAAELPAVHGRPRILLFDNGSHARNYSRALELELDLEAGTAQNVWEYRATPDNFSFITSLARRMANGNTFVAFGAGPGVRQSHGPVEVLEVTPDGEAVFRLEISGPTVNDSFVMYRATPLTDIGGEDLVTVNAQ